MRRIPYFLKRNHRFRYGCILLARDVWACNHVPCHICVISIWKRYYTPSYTLLSNIEWKIELKPDRRNLRRLIRSLHARSTDARAGHERPLAGDGRCQPSCIGHVAATGQRWRADLWCAANHESEPLLHCCRTGSLLRLQQGAAAARGGASRRGADFGRAQGEGRVHLHAAGLREQRARCVVKSSDAVKV